MINNQEFRNYLAAGLVCQSLWPGVERVTVPYLTFASAESFTIGVKNTTKNWDGALYYSTDTTSWNEWDGTTTIASAAHNGEYRIYMRGSGNTVITGSWSVDTCGWVLTGSGISCNGNIENLLDYETVMRGEHPSMADSCYRYMFSGCTGLIQAPELPATTLAYYCYGSMFYECTSLTKAPELPATTLAHQCYGYMFRNCTSLTKAPELPATTLDDYCYRYMFAGCISLTQAPELPATTLTTGCYNAMFRNCTSLTKAPELPATTLARSCYNEMLRNCTSLTKVPELPATTLAQNCYHMMFDGCTSIKISATQTDEYITEYRIPISGTGITETDSLKNMFINTGGTFTDTPEINTTYYLHESNSIV